MTTTTELQNHTTIYAAAAIFLATHIALIIITFRRSIFHRTQIFVACKWLSFRQRSVCVCVCVQCKRTQKHKNVENKSVFFCFFFASFESGDWSNDILKTILRMLHHRHRRHHNHWRGICQCHRQRIRHQFQSLVKWNTSTSPSRTQKCKLRQMWRFCMAERREWSRCSWYILIPCSATAHMYLCSPLQHRIHWHSHAHVNEQEQQYQYIFESDTYSCYNFMHLCNRLKPSQSQAEAQRRANDPVCEEIKKKQKQKNEEINGKTKYERRKVSRPTFFHLRAELYPCETKGAMCRQCHSISLYAHRRLCLRIRTMWDVFVLSLVHGLAITALPLFGDEWILLWESDKQHDLELNAIWLETRNSLCTLRFASWIPFLPN